MPATIRDVAAAAGVSTATVSRALHAGPGVSTRTRLRVEEAARRLAYRPSATAARLASGKQGSIAFVVSGRLTSDGVEILDGVCATLADAGVDCSLHVAPSGDVPWETLVADLAGRADAAVVLGTGALAADLPAPLPVVVVGRDGGPAPSVSTDIGATAGLAAGHLVRTGYRRIAVLRDAGTAADVVRLVAEAGGRHLEVGHDVEVVGDGTESAARAAAGVLAAADPPDALLCTSDRIVRGAARALALQGMWPGDDVGLLGIGGEQVGADLEVSMVVEPRRALGAEAARLALGLLAAAPSTGERVRLEPELVVRWSTLRRRRNLA